MVKTRFRQQQLISASLFFPANLFDGVVSPHLPVHGSVQAHDSDEGQVVPLAAKVIVGVVRGCDLHVGLDIEHGQEKETNETPRDAGHAEGTDRQDQVEEGGGGKGAGRGKA